MRPFTRGVCILGNYEYMMYFAAFKPSRVKIVNEIFLKSINVIVQNSLSLYCKYIIDFAVLISAFHYINETIGKRESDFIGYMVSVFMIDCNAILVL